MYFKIFFFVFLIIILLIIYTTNKIINNYNITQKNLNFVLDLYEKFPEKIKIKFDKIVEWHKVSNHPLLVERSIKINKYGKINQSRMTIVISLSYFFKNMKGSIDENKWIAWKNILEISKDIETKCIKYLINGNGLVDIIWGIDLDNNKEKIYLENPKENKIYSFVFPIISSENSKKPKETYEYDKISKILNKFQFYYKKLHNNYHFFLKEVIIINNCIIHIVSVNKDGGTIYYYLK